MRLTATPMPVPSTETPPIYFTPAELARRIDVSAATVRRWIATGQLHAVRVGGRWRIPNQPQEPK